MPWMARRLIRSDTLKPADAIVVLGAMRIERTIEAGTLYREGWAPRVYLLRPPDLIDAPLERRLGIHIPAYLDIQADVLRQMQVPASAIGSPADPEDSTRAEAEACAVYARKNGFRRIIVVTSPYHTTRARATFVRAMKGSCDVIMRADRYEPADTDRWWTAFPDRYDVVTEYLKRVYALIW